jgi:heme o synthase
MTSNAAEGTAWRSPAEAAGEKLASFLLLTKPRIALLVAVTGVTSMVLEGSLLGEPWRFAAVLLGIIAAAGSANALNQYWDRDIDALMLRTRKRPLPNGKLEPRQALFFGVGLGAASAWLLHSAGNTLAAALGVGAIAFYVLLYTMWLKRRTPLNIVIGGAAGASAPLIGWAAGAGELGAAPLLLALIIFLWTPPHFWALALYTKEEYALAGVPMLPVTAGEDATRVQIAVYTALLLPTVALFGFSVELGWIFFAGSTLLGADLVRRVVRLLRGKDEASAKGLFHGSLFYLLALFALVFVSSFLGYRS